MRKTTLQKIIANGGATISARGRLVSYKSGYQVSNRDCYIISTADISAIINAINNTLKTMTPADYLGLWIDNGYIYIDLSTRITDKAEAIYWGKMLRQRAIYN